MRAAADWGSVPEWVGGIGTAGALLLGFYLMLRDRQQTERVQASQVVAWLEGRGGFSSEGARVTVHNASNLPITRPMYVYQRLSQRRLRRLLGSKTHPFIRLLNRDHGLRHQVGQLFHDPQGKEMHSLAAGGTAVAQLRLDVPMTYDLHLHFRDARGALWRMNVRTAHLRRLPLRRSIPDDPDSRRERLLRRYDDISDAIRRHRSPPPPTIAP